MKGKRYSVSLFFPTKTKMKGTGLTPINITVNLSGGIQFRMRIKLYATRQDFVDALAGKGGSQEVKELRRQMNDYVVKAETILERIPNPTKETFVRLFKSETDLFAANRTDIRFMFDETIEELKTEQRLSTADNYKMARNSLLRYKKQIAFEEVDLKFLNGYISWVESNGNSKSTAHCYIRALRAIFNKAIKAGYISKKNYPFDNFSAGRSTKSKEVLYPEQIKKLLEYQPKGVRETRAKDYFFFCYLCNGMNFKDVVYLKYSNIKGDMLCFIREKTKRTSRDAKEIKVYLHPEARAIIERLGNKPQNNDTPIFPITNGRLTYAEMETARKRHKRTINRNLVSIGQKLGFAEHVCLGIARHSFATTLKIGGTPTSFIGEAMGHGNSATTEHYLKTLPDEKYKVLSEALLNCRSHDLI